MSLLLIDDQGELWRGDSRKLRETFDSPFSGGEFVEYAVKNLGFVAINDYGGSCQARLRPGFVTERAFEVLKAYIQRPRIARVVLTLFENGWRDELVQARSAPQRLLDILANAKPSARQDHVSQALPVSSLVAQPLLSDIFRTWPHLTQAYEPDTLVRLLRSVLKERFAVIKRPLDQDRLYFQQFGDKMFPHYQEWRTCAIGAPIDELPDRTYGRWISGVYSETLGESLPRLDAVDTIIRCPVRGRVRSRYRRLIFPLPASPSCELLIGGSIEDNSIDLRLTARGDDVAVGQK